MNNPFSTFPDSAQSTPPDSGIHRHQITIAQSLWFISGICLLLAVYQAYFSGLIIDFVFEIDGSLILGCGFLFFTALTLLLVSPFVYLSKNWALRSILLIQWAITSLILAWQIACAIWAFMRM